MKRIDQYINDKRFVDWVFNPLPELEEYWTKYQIENPMEKKYILLAKELLEQFKTVDKEIADKDEMLMFARILDRIDKEKQKNDRRRYLHYMSAAAFVFILFTVGYWLFYIEPTQKNDFFYEPVLAENVGEETLLVRSNGDQISIDTRESVIEHSSKGELIVDEKILEPTKAEAVDRKKDSRKEKLNHLIVPYGRTSRITLTDGTKVHLNAGSRLLYPEEFIGAVRKVQLVGEGFFEVAHDKEHPFIVETSDIDVRVLGTKFNVSAYATDSRINTVLAEGKVQLETKEFGLFKDKVVLVPGKMAIYNKDNHEVSTQQVDVDNYVMWKDGLMKFNGIDLSSITRKLERFYNITFRFQDPLLGNIRIRGKLDLNESQKEVMTRIEIVTNLKIKSIGENAYEILEK
ncbi:DUF4974 domain-containing protein [Puteibacter caeruleilacunae]|nr:DUF4974 domain-containing protein [Puteibacter caeruleilacunae]